MKTDPWCLCALILVGFTASFAQDTDSDESRLGQVRREARENSAVSRYAFFLTDVHGPRLSGSPSYRKAAEWTARTLRDLGLENVELHSAT